jgi:transcriptional regulator with XRE-family HTH domain
MDNKKQGSEEFAIRVGQAFKHFRELRKMSQVELAAAAGCSQGTVSLVESGEHSNLATLRRLAEALNCKFSRIIRLAEEEDPRIDDLIQRNKKLLEKLRKNREAVSR